MTSPRRWLRITVAVLGVAVLLALAAWAYHGYVGSRRAVATIVPYNHTNMGIPSFYVDGTWGGVSHAQTGGGRSMCCVTIPERWHDKLQVTVKWQNDDDGSWQERRVSIPRYDEPGEIQVHFYGGDSVKVIITNWDLRWPGNPLHAEWLKELEQRKKENDE
jgi:hypothetical protein